MSPAISVENVSKTFRLYHDKNQTLKSTVMRGRRARYEEFRALDGVSLEIEHGQTYGFIGHNGSGKSTLLKCIARILRPDDGRIVVDGKISALLELGAGFHPELSGKDNIFLNGTILGIPSREIHRKYDEIVEFAGLERFIDTPVKNYSSGMYVRLGFSVAINVDPDILLVDEVLAVGDEEFQRRCNEKFAEMRARDKTIVVVSHGLGAVRNLCDRLAWLDHGQLRMIGDAGEVIDTYVGEVQTDRSTSVEEGSNRWGSGEVLITDVELLDTRGVAVSRLSTGDELTIRISYDAADTVEQPVFAFSIHTLEGHLVTGPNSREAGVPLERIRGRGTVEIAIPRVMLLPGSYDLTVSAMDHSLAHPFDVRQNLMRFDVFAGVPHETQGGVMSLGGQWSHHTP